MSKKWEEMSRKERRIAVAKDVIQRINSFYQIESQYGYVVGQRYVDKTYDKYNVSGGKRVSKKDAEKLLKTCSVCARGAMMLAKTASFNNTFITLEIDHQTSTTEALSDCFSEAQLLLIEQTFELGDHHWRLINDRYRLLAIMQNIVDHKGTFRPNLEYQIVKN